MVNHAIIFDMNGVIIDDEHIHELAFKQIVESYGIPLSHDDYLTLCAGKTDRVGFESIAKQFNKTIDIDSALQQKSQRYLELFPQCKKAYPGVIELINRLTKHYKLAVTSSSSRKEVDLVLKEFSINDLFDVTISADDMTKGKPDPQPYILTAQKLKAEPNRCIVIEDSKSGVISAKSAGMKCIAITTTHTKDDLLQADRIVSTFEEITDDFIDSLVRN